MKLPLVHLTLTFLALPAGIAQYASLIKSAQVLIRKSSKSPGSTVGVDFRVGYGTEHLEIADDAVQVRHSVPSLVPYEISSGISRDNAFLLWTICWEVEPPCRCVAL
jgi:hypothetical protein